MIHFFELFDHVTKNLVEKFVIGDVFFFCWDNFLMNEAEEMTNGTTLQGLEVIK